MNVWQRRLAWGSAVLVLAVISLIVADPYIPQKRAIGIPDVVARKRFEEIVASHGYNFRYERNVRDEVYVVIDRITPNEYQRIYCEYDSREAKRLKAQGVTILDEGECEF